MQSALLPIMRRQHSIMSTQLRFIVDSSIDDLIVFLAKACENARVRSNALRVFAGVPRDISMLGDPDHEGRLLEVATYGLDGLAAPREQDASAVEYISPVWALLDMLPANTASRQQLASEPEAGNSKVEGTGVSP